MTANNATRIVKDLLSISAGLQRVGNRIAAEYKLKQQQFVVLNEIVAKGKINQKQLIGELLFEKSNVSKIVKKLRMLGLIRIIPSTEDRRITMITATSSGKKVSAECVKKFNAWNRNWIVPLTNNEIAQTIKVLERLRKLSQ